MATGNIARNDITGRYIKSAPPTTNYRDGFDTAFNKKTLRVCLEGEQIEIKDENAWVGLETPIGYSEFMDRLRKYKQDSK